MNLRLLTVIALLCFFSQNIYCTNKQIDSLEKELTRIDNQFKELIIYEKLSGLYQNIDIQKAKLYSYKFFDLASKLKKDTAIAQSYMNIGNVNYHLDDFENCLKNYFRALHIADSLKMRSLQSALINNIGAVYFQLKNFTKTLEYCERALQLKKEEKDTINIANFLTNIGSIYFMTGDYEKSYSNYIQALTLFKKTGSVKGIADVSNNIGEFFLEKNQPGNALNYFETSLQNYQMSEDKKGQARIYYNLGRLWYLKQNFEKAEQYILESLSISQSIDSKELKIENFKLLTELYIKSKQADKAMTYFNLFLSKKDSVFSTEIASKIARLQTNFEINKKEQENILLQQQIDINSVELNSQKQKKNTFIFISLLFLLSTILFLYAYRIIKRTNKKLIAKSEELEIVNKNLQELNATKDKLSSIIAHEIKNPFNYVLGFSELILMNIDTISKDKLKQYVEMIQQSTTAGFELLTNLMDWSVTQTGRLQIDQQNLDAYIIIKINIKLLARNANLKNITLETDLSEELMVYSDQKLFDTVLRNLIHNAIKFTGIGGKIIVSAEKDDQFAYISVIDNGVGIPEENLNSLFSIGLNKTTIGTNSEKGSGLGLVICKEFIERNGGELTIESKEGIGSRFTFTIPIAKK